MRRRCADKHGKNAKWYANKGIAICSRWESFLNFASDMGKPPRGLMLERIDNAKGYSPTNCKWATAKEQSRNRCITKRITAFGVTKSAGQWSEDTGIGYQAIIDRLWKLGWSNERAVSVPVRKWKGRAK